MGAIDENPIGTRGEQADLRARGVRGPLSSSRGQGTPGDPKAVVGGAGVPDAGARPGEKPLSRRKALTRLPIRGGASAWRRCRRDRAVLSPSSELPHDRLQGRFQARTLYSAETPT